MTTPSSGPISMGDVQTETGLVPNMFNFYTVSIAGGNGLGQYHNLDMGPGNNLTYRTAIYDPQSLGASGENLKLENFYNYNQNPNGRFDITLNNSSTDTDVDVDLFIADPYSSPITYLQVWGRDNGPGGANTRYSLPRNGGNNFTQTNVDIGVAMSTANFPNGVYTIYADFDSQFIQPFPPPPPPPPVPPIISGSGSASDTDNVGAGTSRTLQSGAIRFGGASGPVSKIPIVTGNIPGGTGIGIFVNKRTTFSITFS